MGFDARYEVADRLRWKDATFKWNFSLVASFLFFLFYDIGMNYGENIYQLRKEKDISQEALAAAIGTTRQQVSRWECGSAVPSAKYVYALAEFFACPVGKILGEEDPEEEKQRGHISVLPARFANFAFLMALLSVIFFFVFALLKPFSDDLAHALHVVSGEVDLETRAQINLAVRELSEKICLYAAVGESIVSGGLFLGLLMRFVHDAKQLKSKIDVYEMFASLYHASIFVFAPIAAMWVMMTVGTHVGYLPLPYLDSFLFLLGGLLISSVICLSIYLLVRLWIGKRWMLNPSWSKKQKILDLSLIVLGGGLSIAFIILSAPSYVAFVVFGYLYFGLAAILLGLYFLLRYRPFGKKA